MQTQNQSTGVKTFGQLPKGAEAKKQDLFEQIPTVVPGKPGFEIGDTLYGAYLSSKLVVSEKFMNASGTRILHTFEDLQSGTRFGIWGTGLLDAVLLRLDSGRKIGVKLAGTREPIKKGHSPSYDYEFSTLDGRALDIDWSRKPSINADSETNPPDEAGEALTF